MNRTSDRAAEWVYRGIWAVLARWFKVPSEPPTLPVRPGDKIQSFKPSPSFIQYLKLWFWLKLTAVDVLFLAGWIASFFVRTWLGLVLTPVFIAVAILPDIFAYIAIHLRYDTTWYILTDRSLRIRRGIWTIRETTVTFENVQNVSVLQGPVEKHYGIANVVVKTAGGGTSGAHQKGGGESESHKGLIEGIDDAAQVRDLIMAKVRRSRSAGLGDETAHETGQLRFAATKEQVAVLREIKDSVLLLRDTVRA